MLTCIGCKRPRGKVHPFCDECLVEHLPPYRKVITPTDEPNHPVLGRRFKSFDSVYLCDSWEENAGYWMTNTSDPTDRRNVSERAINRTYHPVGG
jgi:hypothetical protein